MLQIAFLTGRSNRTNWSLSPSQDQFLSQFEKSDRRLVPLNFPYEPFAKEWAGTSLLRASLSNIGDYAISRFPDFQKRYAPSVCELINQADHTVFLAGSCGLELLNNLHLPADVIHHFSVFAYGPVARRLTSARHLTIQGKHDLISKVWFDRVDFTVNAGHMNYLACPELYVLCETFISDVEKELTSKQVLA